MPQAKAPKAPQCNTALLQDEEGIPPLQVSRYTLHFVRDKDICGHKETQRIYRTGESKRLPVDLVRRAIRRLEYIDLVNTLNDLRVLPGNRLHQLKKDRKGQHAIAINEQWRICFRFVDGDAYDVEITDYH